MTATEAIIKARKALEIFTPLPGDCGKLCNGACCRPPDGDDSAGMCLFPGELEIYTPMPAWARLAHEKINGNAVIVCEGTCDRDNRPISCRIFPLLPVIKGWNGKLGNASVVIDRRAYAICPLAENSRRISVDFIKAVKEVAYILSQNEETLAFIQEQYVRQNLSELFL